MALSFQNKYMMKIRIHVFPEHEEFCYEIDENKKFIDLKKELLDSHLIKKGSFYFEFHGDVLDDDMILKDSKIPYLSVVNLIGNDCIKIKVEKKGLIRGVYTIQKYATVSDFKIIKADENKEVRIGEIKRVMDLLKDETSDRLSILKDLNVLYDKFDDHLFVIKEILIEMDFFSFAEEIFENEKEGDEQIINSLVIILRKMYGCSIEKEGMDLFKSKDIIAPLYFIFICERDIKEREPAMKTMMIIAKKYPSYVTDNYYIKKSYEDLLLSSKISHFKEEKLYSENNKFIYIFFRRIIQEGIIKKGGYGTEIIEEIIFIGELINSKKEIINLDDELSNAVDDFVKLAKEKGFESKLWNNKNDIVSEDLYINWIESCGLDENKSVGNKDGVIKEEEREKIKKFFDYVTSHSFDIQMKFIYKLPLYTKLFNTNKNGLFLYIYLPLLFKIYHLEEILPLFIYRILDNYSCIRKCYEYIIKLYNEIIERMMKEEKEIEINEENVIIIIFLWSVMVKGGKKEKEIKYLINSTVKILEWLGRIEEEKEEEIKENEKELIKEEKKKLVKEEVRKEEKIKRIINRKEIIICYLVEIVFFDRSEYEKNILEDGRISTMLLEIVKNHLRNERWLIQNGNKKKMIEYIIYSYDKDIDTSNLLSLSSSSFPFSHTTIMNILYSLENDPMVDSELIDDYIFEDIIDLLNNYVDIMKIISECDIKKEIENELLVEWDNSIINNITEKVHFGMKYLRFLLWVYLRNDNFFSYYIENKDKIKNIITIYFNHNNNVKYSSEKEKEKNNSDVDEMISFKPFLMGKDRRGDFIEEFVSSFIDGSDCSILDIYYLTNKSEEGCNIMNIFMKELSGEIVDRIKKRGGNNLKSERRRYEKERMDEVCENILHSLSDMMKYIYKDRNNVYLGDIRNPYCYEGNEEELKEDKDYISDIIEEEDTRECLILYLQHIKIVRKFNLRYSDLSHCSNNSLYYLLSQMEIRIVGIDYDD